jgi:hypothetical protein
VLLLVHVLMLSLDVGKCNVLVLVLGDAERAQDFEVLHDERFERVALLG